MKTAVAVFSTDVGVMMTILSTLDRCTDKIHLVSVEPTGRPEECAVRGPVAEVMMLIGEAVMCNEDTLQSVRTFAQ